MRTAITKKARETEAEVVWFMKTYLEDAEALDGLEFLSMAEAGEMAHWENLAKLNEIAGDKDVARVVKCAVPLQRAHVDAVRELQSQIAMTPTGSYRSALETHLNETRRHSARVAGRLSALEASSNPLVAVVGFWEEMVGQALALGKAPLDLLRGTGGEEKVLKNAKDAAATEALEIATYTAIERLARSVGDRETADLAKSILADEKKMLARIMREISKLTDAVVRAELKNDPSYDLTKTDAGEAVREAGVATARAARKTRAATKRTARNARKVPGVAQAEARQRAQSRARRTSPSPAMTD